MGELVAKECRLAGKSSDVLEIGYLPPVDALMSKVNTVLIMDPHTRKMMSRL